MPNLINVLRNDEKERTKKMTDSERRKVVEISLKSGERGVDWGTCMIFSCSKDCSEQCWAEEYVLLQWE